MFDFNALKVAFFGERTNTDDAVKYASQIAGAEGVTSAMVMYNTLLDQLEQSKQQKLDAFKGVVVSYNAYYDARKEIDRADFEAEHSHYNSLAVWSNMLLEDQEKAGITMVDPVELKRAYNHAQEMMRFLEK